MSNSVFAQALGIKPRKTLKAEASKSGQRSLDVTKGGLAHVLKNEKPQGIFHGSNAHRLRMGTGFKP